MGGKLRRGCSSAVYNWAMQLEYDPTTWPGGTGLLPPVLSCAAETFLRCFDPRPTGEILIAYREGPFPRAFARNTTQRQFTVELVCDSWDWCRGTLHFGHELCHVVAGPHDREGKPSMWVDEVLCEAASFFVIRQMSSDWARWTEGTWRGYALQLTAYAAPLTNDPGRRLPAGETLATYVARHEDALRAAPYNQRAEEAVIANELLRLFEDSPTFWRAVLHLPISSDRIGPFLRQWHQNCPTPQQEGVGQIAERFGVTL